MTGKPVVANELVDVQWLNSLAITVFDTTLSVAAGTIDTGAVLPTNYAHMRVEVAARGDTATQVTTCGLRINNDSGTNYDYETSLAQAATFTATNTPGALLFAGLNIPAATAAASVPGDIIFEILNYAGTTFFKKVTAHGGYQGTTFSATGAYQALNGVWKSTSAINRLALVAGAGNFAVGSRMTVSVRGAG